MDQNDQVLVTSEEVDGKHMIFVAADDSFVVSSPMAGWLPKRNAPDSMGVSHSVAVKCFFQRCSISQVHADINHYGGLSPLTLKFSDDCFSRVFSEFKHSGLPTILEEGQAEELYELEKAVKGMSLDEDAFVLTAADTVAVESFDAVAVAAVPARNGRRARQAVPAPAA